MIKVAHLPGRSLQHHPIHAYFVLKSLEHILVVVNLAPFHLAVAVYFYFLTLPLSELALIPSAGRSEHWEMRVLINLLNSRQRRQVETDISRELPER